MAGYVKELLQDQSLFDGEDMEAGSELHIARIDLYSSLEALYKKGVLDDRHLIALNLYYLGDHRAQLLTVPDVEALLSFAMRQLAEFSGYTDELFIKHALTRYPKYATLEKVFIRNLEKIGETF